MPATDFLTNVETAFLSLIAADPILGAYNPQYWDNDKQVELPRVYITLGSQVSPDETPYQRVSVKIRFEGRPKKQKLSVVVNALKALFLSKDNSDLDTASGNTVKFIGLGVNVTEGRSIEGGLRIWTYGFDIFVLPMV